MSKIEVNKIGPQCGTTLTVGCGSGQTVTVDANTVTLGRSGGTVSLASGATQSGFGRTGSVNWETTPKTANFTASSGEGYFVNTTSGAITMTMPSGSAGSIVSIQDYNKTFDTNSLTISPASGQKINGGNADGDLVIQTEGQGLTFVYVDSTVGWKTVHENEFTSQGSSYIVASGGTITECGNCKIHTFTGPGTFTVCRIATVCAPANNVVSYMVVAGGGGAGGVRGGGGGAGGFREDKSPVTPYTASPLDGAGAITVTATSYPITVGAGGSANPAPARTNGSNSVFSTITSAGGGKGGQYSNGFSGGSGGGGSNDTYTGGAGNTPPTTPAQGNSGGNSTTGAGEAGAGGGGGATAAGSNGNSTTGGNGGNGATTCISGSPTTYSGGGGGGVDACGTASSGGTGGGGDGAAGVGPGSAGTANTGGGGGGTGYEGTLGGAGGSGIVIIRYKFQ